MSLQQAERAAVSRQLREETAQQLYALVLQLDAAERNFGDEKGLSALRTARDLSSGILNDVRALADTILSSSATELRLDVSDDGQGFDVIAVERATVGVGLFELREMLANVHGRLEIESVPGRGTRVVATVRLDQGDTA